LCPIGSIYPAPLIEALGLDEDRILLHSLVGGKIHADQMLQWTPGAESGGEHTPAERLRRFLDRKLPTYMAPSSIAILETLPLTANGKVDRKALAAMAAAGQPKPRESGRPPESQLECKLARIVERVLERDGIGIETNFFDLGANSFSIVQIQNEIRRELGVEVPVVELFRNPRLSLLAGFLLQEQPSNDDGLLEAVERAERRRAEKRRRENRQAAGGVA
jgi:acyl carrier protein